MCVLNLTQGMMNSLELRSTFYMLGFFKRMLPLVIILIRQEEEFGVFICSTGYMQPFHLEYDKQDIEILQNNLQDSSFNIFPRIIVSLKNLIKKFTCVNCIQGKGRDKVGV